MTIEDKYQIQYVNGKRYYQFDLNNPLPILENVVPFYFQYRDIEIYASAWNKMTIQILTALDEIFPKTEEELLNIKYFWTKTEVFSRIKKTNFSSYKNVFVNTNRTSTHSMMNIQGLLKEYNIDFNECFFLVRRHPSAEPKDARDYYRCKTMKTFKKSMEFKKLDVKRIDNIIGNFTVINKILSTISRGYDDFFLFDDYYCFKSYKIKTIDLAKKKFPSNLKIVNIFKRCLGYLDDFYKNIDFYKKIDNIELSNTFIEKLGEEIEFLFNNQHLNAILSSKLYSRMLITHESEMNKLGELNNSNDLYRISVVSYSSKYYFKEPFITQEKKSNISNDELIISYAYSLDEFTILKLNSYIKKMHLKKPNSYLDFINACSDEYVQIDNDKLIRKQKLDISKEILEKIKRDLAYYIENFGPIYSKTYVGYSSLPKFGLRWNKSLLLGIIRSFLNNKFKIKYKSNSYKKLEYTIDLLK